MKTLKDIWNRIRAIEFRKVITWKNVIEEGMVVPRFYGIASRDFCNDTMVCYPVPFNWIVRWSTELSRILKFPTASKFEQQLNAVYQEGFKKGREQATIDFLADLDRSIEERTAKEMERVQKQMKTSTTPPLRSETHDEED